MAPVTRRPAPRAAAPAPRTAGPATRRTPVAQASSSGYRGAEGLRKMQEEQEKAEARREANASMSGAPFRFFCPMGNTREIVVVDDAPDFFRHEHNMRDGNGKWSIFTSCIAEHANCPVCLSNPDKQPYYAMYLTIIDLTPYVNKDNIEVPWSKKLLVVKSTQQKKIMRLYERYQTLRGMVLQMTRDGEKDAAIGNDIEYIEHMSEEDLEQYVNVYEDKNRKTVEVIGYEVFDYDALFPAQTEEMLAALVGGAVNNYDSHSRNIGRGQQGGRAPAGSSTRDGWQDRAPATSRPAPRAAPPAARGPVARGPVRAPARAAPAEPEAEAGAEGEYEEEPPAAPVRTRVAPVARRPEPAYDDPPQRAARPAPRVAPRAEPEPEPVDDSPRTSLAARRQQLRGGR